jgi:hypothetical protein
MEKLGWVLVLLLAAGCSRSGPQAAPAAQPAPASSPAPKPQPKKKLWHRILDPLLVPTPMGRQPEKRELNYKTLLEDIAFKSEQEVEALFGPPDGRLLHKDEDHVLSWYYKAQLTDGSGKKVCPEIRFIGGQGRNVVFLDPEAMRSQIKDALAAAAEGPDPRRQNFTFKEGFKYLGVGTPQETVLEDFGQPDARHPDENGAEAWDYDTIVVEGGAPKKLRVLVKDGKVIQVKARE